MEKMEEAVKKKKQGKEKWVFGERWVISLPSALTILREEITH